MLKIYVLEDNYILEGVLPSSLASEIPSLIELETKKYSCPLLQFSSFVLASYILKNKKSVEVDEDTKKYMKRLAQSTTYPKAYLRKEEKGQVFLDVPNIPAYTTLIGSLGARFRRLNTYSVPQSRLYEFYRIIYSWSHPFLPKVRMSKELINYINKDLSNSQDMEALFNIEPNQLYTINFGYKMTEEKVIKGMKKLKWDSIGDLILTRPKRYEDRTATISYKTAPYGIQSMFETEFIEFLPVFGNKMIKFKVRDLISGIQIDCQMFGGQHLKTKLKAGDRLNIVGMKIRHGVMNASQILTDDDVRSLPIAPIYNASPSNGFTSKVITNCTTEVLKRFNGSDLFTYINYDYKFWDAVKELHYPKNVNSYSKAIDTLAFYEMVAMQLLFIEKKMDGLKSIGIVKRHVDDGYFDNAMKKLPFDLTKGQKDALKQMFGKFSTEEPADVLLSGDVGSGKSLIATMLALYVVDNKQQVVIAGPTEVLARQLYQSVMKIVNTLEDKPNVEFIASSIKGTELKETKKRIKDGEADIIVGTHSVFNLKYKNLGFVVIDEQQKFGAAQREKLRDFGREDGKKPDMLSQTATPIPRSTAQAFYGDIDLIQVIDKPAGRKEIKTSWIKRNPEEVLSEKDNEMWRLIYNEIKNKNQVFIICPAVEDKEDTAFTTVKKAEKIVKKINPKLCRSIYGTMSKEKQKEVINEFRNGDFPILIGSSILEVGIDIPQATVMVVLDADRFGASSLHQIRGRVGRNDLQSYCILVSDSETKSADARLTSLVNSTNGFDIAMSDLHTRKEGDILGIRQSGESTFRFADFIDHSQLIEFAQAEAKRLYKSSLRNQALVDSKMFLKKEEN